MTTEELARKAYERSAGEDDPSFDALPKGVAMSLMEIAEKNGDASVFAQEVEKIVIENNRAAEAEEVPVLESEEELATEAQVRESLNAKSVPELKTLAKDLGIEIPREANRKDEIIEVIVAQIATKEVVQKLGIE